MSVATGTILVKWLLLWFLLVHFHVIASALISDSASHRPTPQKPNPPPKSKNVFLRNPSSFASTAGETPRVGAAAFEEASRSDSASQGDTPLCTGKCSWRRRGPPSPAARLRRSPAAVRPRTFPAAFLPRSRRPRSPSARTTYHSNADLKTTMDDLRRLHPGKAFVYSVGDSVKGTPLWVIAVAARKPESHVTLRPELKFVGNMHGNEVVGRELIIRFARHLLDNYGVLENVTKLVNHSRIHLMPTMNPDGFDAAIVGECTGVTGRANAKDMDLNRNFPDAFDPSHSPQRQKETQLVMDWATTTQFVLSANMHGGALVANYPFDNYANSDDYTARYSISPDDALFRKMAYTYSKYNLPMKKSAEFESGVTNGAQWYPLPGGMQDWMYLKGGCMELTLEVSDCKYPLYEQIDGFWNDNRDSMLSFLYKGLIGVKGIVKDANNNPLSDVRVSVVGRGEVVSRTTPSGEFWRLLLPGRHSLKFKSGNSGATFVNLTLPEFEDFDPNAAVVIDVVLGTEEVGTITMPENSAVEVSPRKQYLSGMIVIIFLIIRI